MKATVPGTRLTAPSATVSHSDSEAKVMLGSSGRDIVLPTPRGTGPAVYFKFLLDVVDSYFKVCLSATIQTKW